MVAKVELFRIVTLTLQRVQAVTDRGLGFRYIVEEVVSLCQPTSGIFLADPYHEQEAASVRLLDVISVQMTGAGYNGTLRFGSIYIIIVRHRRLRPLWLSQSCSYHDQRK